jgi:histidinol-phosphate aminotransferase
MKKYEDLCKKKNLEYIPSWTNFITIFVENSTKLSDELLKIGIIIRNLKSYNLEAVRITIGSSEQNDKVIKMLDKLI